jgi:hypothetical protein
MGSAFMMLTAGIESADGKSRAEEKADAKLRGPEADATFAVGVVGVATGVTLRPPQLAA